MGKGKEFGSAERSVAVDGRCYDSGAVNYALYGKMAKLCNKNLGDVLGTIDAWKREAYGTQTDPETRSWCVTAYEGWACSAGRGSCNMGTPFSWTPYAVAADHPTYSGRAFTYTWLPYVWKGEYKEKGFSFLEVYGDR